MQIGGLAVWLYEYLAGIRSDPEKPGFRHAVIHPWSGGRSDLRQGIAPVDVRHTGQFTLDVTVPPNTTAPIWVRAKAAAGVTESGKKATDVRGVKFLRAEAGYAVYEVESDACTFRL